MLLGLDEDNKPGISSCVTFTDIEKPTEVNIPGLVESTTYEIACMCYNQYPVWPTSVAYGLENNFISTFTGRTSSPETKEEEATDDDSAKYLVVWLLVLIFS